MGAEVIRSTANPQVKRLRALKDRRARAREGVCFVEGIHSVLQAAEHGARVETLVVSEELLTSRAAIQAVAAHEAGGGRVLRLSKAAFERVAEREHPAGLGAVVAIPTRSFDELDLDKRTVIAWLHEVSNPGNLGTIVRTVDALGGAGCVVSGISADPYDPTALKASMGTVFARPVVVERFAEEVLETCRERAISVVATSAHAQKSLADLSTSGPCALLFGSEAHGLPGELLEAADDAVTIPMRGSATSLNLAVAAGICLYEVTKVLSR